MRDNPTHLAGKLVHINKRQDVLFSGAKAAYSTWHAHEVSVKSMVDPSAPTLLTLPEDVLTQVFSQLNLPEDAAALRQCASSFSTSDGTLAAACRLACARILGCDSNEVAERLNCAGTTDHDWLHMTACAVWSHAKPTMACSNHTLLVSAGGGVLACGDNFAGQLGNGMVSQFSSTYAAPSLTFSDEYLAAAQRRAGAIDSSLPGPVPLPSAAAAVGAGRAHSLALCANGDVWAWGDSSRGQCGRDGGPADVVVAAGAWPTRIEILELAVPSGERVVMVAAGALHSLFLTNAGRVFGCGGGLATGGYAEELAAGGGGGGAAYVEPSNVTVPRLARMPEAAVAIAAGHFHSLALGRGGTRVVYGWGSAACGQLGRRRPPPPAALGETTDAGAAAAAAGGHQGTEAHAATADAAALINQQLFEHGEASAAAAAPPYEPFGAREAPEIVEGAHGPCAQVAAGAYHTLLLTQRGEVFSCGQGNAAALGHGDLKPQEEPKVVEALRGVRVVRVAAGAAHSAFVSARGELFMCGSSAHGRLGLRGLAELSRDGTTGVWCRGEGSAQVRQGVRLAPKCSLPRQVPMPTRAPPGGALEPWRVRSVACGTDHTVVVCAGGAVFCFGRGQAGQLGAGDRKDRLEPVAVPGFARGAAAAVEAAEVGALRPAAALSEASGGFGGGGGGETGGESPRARESGGESSVGADAPTSPRSSESEPKAPEASPLPEQHLTAAQLAQRTNTTTSVLSRWG